MRSVPRAVWSLEENTEHLLVFAWNLRCKHPLQPGGGRAFYLVLASLIAANTSLVLFQYRNTCTSRMVFHTAPSTNDSAAVFALVAVVTLLGSCRCRHSAPTRPRKQPRPPPSPHHEMRSARGSHDAVRGADLGAGACDGARRAYRARACAIASTVSVPRTRHVARTPGAASPVRRGCGAE